MIAKQSQMRKSPRRVPRKSGGSSTVPWNAGWRKVLYAPPPRRGAYTRTILAQRDCLSVVSERQDAPPTKIPRDGVLWREDTTGEQRKRTMVTATTLPVLAFNLSPLGERKASLPLLKVVMQESGYPEPAHYRFADRTNWWLCFQK